MHEPVYDILAVEPVQVKFIGNHFGVVGQPVKIAWAQDVTIRKGK